MKKLLLLTSLLYLFSPQNITLSQVNSKTDVQKSEQIQGPLTYAQLEKLLKNPVSDERDVVAKDQAIATEIRRRGIEFQLTDKIFENFRKLGAGPNTIQALNELRISRSTTNIEHDIKDVKETVRTFTEEARRFLDEKKVAEIPSPRREDNKKIELPPSILEKLDRLEQYEKAGIPLDPEIYFEEGRLFFANGNNIKSIEKLRIAVNLNPTFAKAHYLLSVAYNHERDYRNQLFHAQRTLALAGTDLKLKGHSLNSIGIAHNRLGNPTEALTAFSQAKNIFHGTDNVGEARVSNNLGLLYLAKKDLKNAKESFDNALRLYRDLSDVRGQARSLHYLGLYHFNLRESNSRLDDAYNYFQAALNLLKDTNHNDLKVGSWVNKCLIYYYKKRMDDSERCYGDIMRALPVSSEDLAGIYLNIGNIRQYKEDYEGSIGFYQKALAHTKSTDYLAFSAGNLVNSNQAEGTTFESNKLKILKSLVHSYLKLNRLNDAAPYIKQILEIDEKDADSYYNMACYYSLLKNRNEAMLYLKKGRKFFSETLIDWSKKDPDLEFIRADPEFKRIMYSEP